MNTSSSKLFFNTGSIHKQFVAIVLLIVLVSSSLTAQELLKLDTPSNYENKILVVTNRDYSVPDADHIVFSTHLHQNMEYSFVTSFYSNEDWSFEKNSSFEEMFEGSFKYDDWLVFVHGDGKTLLSAVDRAKEIQQLHNINVLVYSWPAKDPELGGIKNFKNSYSNVEKSALSFYQMIGMLEELKASAHSPFENQGLSLFLHSLGNFYLERLYKEDLLALSDQKIFDNLIINAAAVETKGHNVWVESVDFAERIYINSNDDDISLSGLRVLTRLGRQLGERAEAPFAENATYVNFTKAVGFPGSMGPSHSYYFASVTERSENIKSYYTTIFHGKQALLENSELFSYIPEIESYSIIF